MSTTPNTTLPESLQKRLDSLDAFRGLTIAAMITVNNPGTWSYVYEPLLHVNWNGLAPADLIFPSFVFMVGVSIAFSFCKHLAQGTPRGSLASKVFTRAAKIYLVGMALCLVEPLLRIAVTQTWTTFNYWEFFTVELRYTGVLHRIALVFLACGLLFLYTKTRTQVVVCTLFLVGYWFCMSYIPMPRVKPISEGVAVTSTELTELPETVAADTTLWHRVDTLLRTPTVELRPGDNLATWVDSKLLPGRPWWGPWNPERNWEEWKKEEPNMQPWDPEGFLSTVPSICSGLIGIFVGLLLLSPRTQERKAILLFFSGALLMAAGYAWGLIFPINKSLWTSSYVLFAAGFSSTVLAACIYYMDILGRKRLLHFAVIFGCNAIAIYSLSWILALFLYGNSFGFWGDTTGPNHLVMNWLLANIPGYTEKCASLTYALLFVAVNFIPAYVLYKAKVYIRL
ncbi:MAG: hypothetical protein FWC43_04665 [Planctomycetaceae bacterium]|nr:hypothetical protein [Planctomycetaceae bacterium]